MTGKFKQRHGSTCDWVGHLTYLASPYTHARADTKTERAQAVCEYAAYLCREGALVYCPIAHGVSLEKAGELPQEWAFWKRLGVRMLQASDSLIVYCLPGWKASKGVTEEIEIAESLGLKIEYVQPRETWKSQTPRPPSDTSGNT